MKKKSEQIVLQGWVGFDDAQSEWNRKNEGLAKVKWEYVHPNDKTTVLTKAESK